MMMMSNPKKIASLIVSRARHGEMGKGEKPSGYAEGGEVEADPLLECAKELLHAIETKSPALVAEAFQAMFMHCDSEEDEAEGEPASGDEYD